MASLWQEREKQLLALRERAKRGGGEARMNKQRAAGKLTARERLTLLFDPDTFVEIGELVESRIDDFGMDERRVPGDGVVIGYGRVGRVTAKLLTNMGAHVTVCARSVAQRAWAKVDGCSPLPLEALEQAVKGADAVLNTVPTLLVDRQVLAQLDTDTLVMDLASKPGGVDRAAAADLGIPVHWALALPGKVAPKTAGEILCETIQNILTEKGVL